MARRLADVASQKADPFFHHGALRQSEHGKNKLDIETSTNSAKMPGQKSAPEPHDGMQPQASSVDNIVSEIVQGLENGRYVAGQRLIESDLARRFSVGRGTVREALQRLEAEGLITTSLHRGAYIRSFSRKCVKDVLELTEHAFALVGRLAAERYNDPADLMLLRRHIAELGQHLSEGGSNSLAHLRYQVLRQIFVIADNLELLRMLPRFQGTVIRTQFRTVFDARASFDELTLVQATADAIAAQDKKAAERAMREYVRRPALAILELPDNHFVD